jgi:hypothetical protein
VEPGPVSDPRAARLSESEVGRGLVFSSMRNGTESVAAPFDASGHALAAGAVRAAAHFGNTTATSNRKPVRHRVAYRDAPRRV